MTERAILDTAPVVVGSNGTLDLYAPQPGIVGALDVSGVAVFASATAAPRAWLSHP